MAILVNQNNNLSGENLLASSSLENSINEARNLSVSIDSKIADLKIKAEEIKTDACDKLDQKEKALKASINLSTTNAVNNIGKAVKDLEQGSALIKDAWKTTSTIVAHIVLFVVALALILFLAMPTIKQAKDVLSDNKNVLQTAHNLKKENEKLRKENQGLNDELVSLNGFVNAIFKDKEKARREYQKWKSSYN